MEKTGLVGKKFFAPLVATVVVVTIVLAGFLSRNNPFSSLSENKSNSPTPTEVQYPVDTENDGVYTNYKYKFRFKYPIDIFKYQLESGMTWSNEPWSGGMGPTATSESAISLNILIREDVFTKYDADGSNYVERYINKFTEFLDTENGSKVSWGAVKLSEEDFGDYKRITYYYKTPPEKASELSEYYAAWWLKEGAPVVVLEYSAGFSMTLNEYKPVFDKIVSSFEFF